MNDKRNVWTLFSVFFFILVLFLLNVSAAPIVTLVSPAQNAVFLTNNISFVCNATDSTYVKNVDLFHSIGGTFSLNQTTYLGEIGSMSGNVLLMHLNNDSSVGENDSHVFDHSGNGNNGTVSGAAFNASLGKFFGAFQFVQSEKDYIDVQDSDSIDLTSAGAIEVWINLSSTGAWMPVVHKGNDFDFASAFSVWIKPSGQINFYITDTSYATSGILQTNRRYHVVVQWNSTHSAIYIDGVLNDTVTIDSTPPINAKVLRIGGNGPQDFWLDGVIDELAMYNRTLTSSEIDDHFNRTLVNSTSQNFTLTGLPDGTYLWNCLVNNYDSDSNFSSTNFTVSVDTSTPPTVRSITIMPNSSDDIDPNVNISVTANVTDVSNVSAVIFQWKETGDWTNDSMDLNGGTGLWENATIVVDASGGMYSYRIWSNDTNGISGYSATQNITAAFDYTWNASLSFGNVSGLINTVQMLGYLIINNTGDDTLEFSITDDWPFAIFYNDSETPSYTASAKEVLNITINVTFEGDNSERVIVMNVSASHATETPSPESSPLTRTLTSYTGGPYLSVNIVTFPSSVTQSGTGINLTGTIRNIGNETAQNVTFNFTLPSGWTNTSGNYSIVIGNISPLVTNTSSITVTVTSSAQSGIASLCVWGTGTGNLTTNGCENIAVLCSSSDDVCGAGCTFNNDDDCSSASSGGGGSGGGSGGVAVIKEEFGMELDVPKQIDVYPGESVSFPVGVTSTKEGTVIENVILSLTGHPQSFITVFPSSLDLEFGEKEEFTVEIEAPDYFSFGKYTISLAVKGDGRTIDIRGNTTLVEASEEVELFVRSASERETVELFSVAEESVQNMIDSGFFAQEASSLLKQSREALNSFDYDLSRELSEDVIDIKEEVFALFSVLQNIKQQIDEASSYGIEAPEVEKMHSLAMAAFERGDFDRAEERAKNALLSYSLGVSGRLISIKFFNTYWWVMLTAVAIAAFLILTGRWQIRKFSMRRKLWILKKEDSVIRKLMRDIQLKTFVKREIGVREYKDGIADYEDKLASVEKEKSRLMSGKVHDLRKERERLREGIRDIQRKYFEQRSIGKTSYTKRLHTLRERLGEIEKKGGKAFVLLLLPLLLMGSVGAQGESALEAISSAESQILEMQRLGFNDQRLSDTLKEAKLLLAKEDYIAAESVARFVGILKASAIRVDLLIDDIEELLFDAEGKGVDVSSARKMFRTGLGKFDKERYEEAEELLEQARDTIGDKEAEQALEQAVRRADQENIVGFFHENQGSIAASVIVLVIIGVVFMTGRSIKRRRGMLTSLRDEKKTLEGMVRHVQREYFELQKISKSEYSQKMNQYRKRLNSVKKDIIVSEHRKLV